MNAVDLFAGAGGITEGAESADVRVVWAANHWSAVPSHDLLLASPSMPGSFARSRERAPTSRRDATRSTAWAVVSCAEVHRPYAALIENVVAFTRWSLYPAWCEAMQTLGYTLSPHVLDAADYGIPQNRPPLIIVATRSKAPLPLRPRTGSQRPIGPHIEWDRGPWRMIDKTLAPATLHRIANGRRAFGECFLAPYYSGGSGTHGPQYQAADRHHHNARPLGRNRRQPHANAQR